jgi:L-idonate 5-dehydrogenase
MNRRCKEDVMESLACVIHEKMDLRIEKVPLAAPGETQVMVRVRAGGICGSDLHYYLDGGFGTVRIQEPMILGHEVSGTVEAVGSGVTKVNVGDRIAVNPSRPCGRCVFCHLGQQHHCLDMWFYGSAMRVPHSQGAFRERLIVEELQCESVGDSVSFGEAACAEPLSVALHAVNQAGTLMGKNVLVTGSGPIGALVIAGARYAGAAEVVVTDLYDAALTKAAEMGATRGVNVSVEPGLNNAEFLADKGYFDVAFECTGASPVLRSVIPVVKPRGTIVQVGLTGDVSVPMNGLVGKEISLIGTHRCNSEFTLAVRLIREGKMKVKPIITGTLPLEKAVEAFDLACDRKTQMKMQLSF